MASAIILHFSSIFLDWPPWHMRRPQRNTTQPKLGENYYSLNFRSVLHYSSSKFCIWLIHLTYLSKKDYSNNFLTGSTTKAWSILKHFFPNSSKNSVELGIYSQFRAMFECQSQLLNKTSILLFHQSFTFFYYFFRAHLRSSFADSPSNNICQMFWRSWILINEKCLKL